MFLYDTLPPWSCKPILPVLCFPNSDQSLNLELLIISFHFSPLKGKFTIFIPFRETDPLFIL